MVDPARVIRIINLQAVPPSARAQGNNNDAISSIETPFITTFAAAIAQAAKLPVTNSQNDVFISREENT